MNMDLRLDSTNDPTMRSWVDSANDGTTDFPLQNLPLASFRRRGEANPYRGGIAIGDLIVDLGQLAASGVCSGQAAVAAHAASEPTLNGFMRLGHHAHRALRIAVCEGLRTDSRQRAQFEATLVPQTAAEFRTAADIGDYTDFYSSIHHATAVGRLFRPDDPLLPNYRWVPLGYHGRSSSITVSGGPIRRPCGQRSEVGKSAPILAPTARLDFELELGAFIGLENSLGEPIPIDTAESHLFGLCLLNDWSARDIQAWEYQPLGPFLGKNFATSISPWVVSLQALAPFRTPFRRDPTDPQPLPYLTAAPNSAAGAFDIQLEAWLETSSMRLRGEAPAKISSSNFRHSYWTLAQLVTHHTVNGCNLRAGDLLGTGTQSGPAPHEAGSLLELSAGGRRPLRVGTTDERTFLDDGDRVILRAYCERPGAARIGFGEVSGEVLGTP